MKDHAKFQLLPLGAIRAEGYLKEQLLRSKHGIGGHLDELEPGMIALPFLKKVYVKKWSGGHQDGWGAEISGNYYAGLIQLAFTLDDEELKKKAETWVNGVLKNQMPDGYLGTYDQPDSLIYEDFNAWGTGWGMRALLLYYEATGRQDVFDAVYRCMLWFCDKWAGERKTTYCGALILEPMLYCYRKTGDERLLRFCVDYTEFLPEHTVFGNSYRHMLAPKLQYNSNHTAGYCVMMRLPALVYEFTGTEKYLKATENGIRNLHEKGMHVSGGAVSVAEYLAPVSSMHESEYCSFTFAMQSYAFMSAITGEGKYGDYAERVVYNAAMGAKKKDERAIAYLSAPNQIYASKSSSFTGGNFHVYAPCYQTCCCPVNAVALMPEFIRTMAVHDEEGDLRITAYGPSTIDWNGWTVTQETAYPFRNTVKLHVSGANGRKLYCRIPGWDRGFTVTVDGRAVQAEKDESGYICIDAGSEIELRFKAEVEIIRVDDSDAYKKYPLAFNYGALTFSLPVEEEWKPYYPETETPLAEEWPWYYVRPVMPDPKAKDNYEALALRRDLFPWCVAVDETLKAEDISVEEKEMTGYPFENPWITLRVPGYHAQLAYPPYPKHSLEPYGDKLEVQEKRELTLVPYGATCLRVTYFPRADV